MPAATPDVGCGPGRLDRDARDRLRADYDAVFNCVEAGQAEQAADLLEAHISGFATHMSTGH
jgi:DNA-binding FadR family transcriptional regulator